MNSEARSRPTSLEEMGAVLAPLVSAEGISAGLSFAPRQSDVIIAPFGKSGTTWLQQIVHSLRTRGDMDFDDISRVVPWIETARDLGLDLNAEQRADPRAFKSHLSYHRVPKGGRYIVSLRDPRDAIVSRYRFFENWFFEAGSISLDDFARGSCMPNFAAGPEGTDYWTHFSSWWAVRKQPNVLLLAYENMKQDLPGTVQRIAEFLDIPLDKELRNIVLQHASLEFMTAHKNRFDDLLMRQRSIDVLKLPADSDSSKVRLGEVGSHRLEISAELAAELDAVWASTVAVDCGLESYQDAVQAL